MGSLGSGFPSRVRTALVPAPVLLPLWIPGPPTVRCEGPRAATHPITAHLRQCSDGRDTVLLLCCLDRVATGAAGGELEAGPDHQFPLKAMHTHCCVGQDQSQGPEADYGPREPALCLGQREGAWGTGSLKQVFFFYTIQFFRSKEGHSDLKKRTPLYSFYQLLIETKNLFNKSAYQGELKGTWL